MHRFKEKNGCYPQRALVDQIYRTRANISFCKAHGIRLSAPKLERPNAVTLKADKKLEYQDNTDSIEVERQFSLNKKSYGLEKLVTKLQDTQLTSIALYVFVANLFKMRQRIHFAFFCLINTPLLGDI